MLPFNEGGPETVEMDCRRMRESEIPEQARVACFMAGDPRANEQTGLTVMHTVFLRAHNRIASELYDLNRSLNGNEIYFTTRKIIGALMQKFTYNEWLPIILGMTYVDDFNLKPSDFGHSEQYDSTVNPSITNAFATAAFRFGHSLVQSNME